MGRFEAARNLVAYFRTHPVSRRQPARAAARILLWQARSRLRTGPHTCRWIQDAKLVVERGMSGATGNLYFGLHEFEDMAFLLHFLRPGDLLLDIGANVGTYAVLGAKLCGSEVWAFEPDPVAGSRLARNLAANGIERDVHLHAVAVGDSNGTAGFTRGLDAMNHITADPTEERQVVPIRRLDDLMQGRSPTMIKIDIEGHEDAAFRGAQRTLADPALLAVEAETVTDESDTLLGQHGFSRRWYDPQARLLHREPFGTASNRLYLRHPELVSDRLSTAPAFDVFGWQL